MPTFRHGKKTAVLLNGTDMSPFLNEATTTQTVETAETTTFSDDDKTYITGLADGTISTSGLFDSSAGASDEVLNGTLGNEDNTFTVLPAGNTGGSRAILANGQLTSYEISSPVADVVAISAEVQADGGLLHGVALASSVSTDSASAVTSGVDNGSSTANGGLFNLHVTDNGRDGATTIKVQHSADDATYADLVTFTSVSASTTGGESITSTGTVNQYLRTLSTLAGASGSVTYHVAAARR
ncbi:MAG TPA: hypothetical protein VIG24_06135 [Acidimicrobiia bacterium]